MRTDGYCPWCKVVEEQPCVTKTGKPTKQPHAGRWLYQPLATAGCQNCNYTGVVSLGGIGKNGPAVTPCPTCRPEGSPRRSLSTGRTISP